MDIRLRWLMMMFDIFNDTIDEENITSVFFLTFDSSERPVAGEAESIARGSSSVVRREDDDGVVEEIRFLQAEHDSTNHLVESRHHRPVSPPIFRQ